MDKIPTELNPSRRYKTLHSMIRSVTYSIWTKENLLLESPKNVIKLTAVITSIREYQCYQHLFIKVVSIRRNYWGSSQWTAM